MSMEWQDYPDPDDGLAHTVHGTLKCRTGFHSPELGGARDIYVYLPPDRDRGGPFPVIYMHDGQNLFDEATSFAGEWRVDNTMDALSEEGLPAIVVGIANRGSSRLDEYSPFEGPRGGGLGDEYLRFIVQTLKPEIDRAFPTRPERATTGIAGSSMGGLISLYALFARPDVFGFAAALSPSLWFADRSVLRTVAHAPAPDAALYLDVGTEEGSQALRDVRRLRRLLRRRGFREGEDFLYREDRGAGHNEAAWASRFPDAARFLLERAAGAVERRSGAA